MAKIFTDKIVDFLRTASKNAGDLSFLEVGDTFIIQLGEGYENNPNKQYVFPNVLPLEASTEGDTFGLKVKYSSDDEVMWERERSGTDRAQSSPHMLLSDYRQKTSAVRRPSYVGKTNISSHKTSENHRQSNKTAEQHHQQSNKTAEHHRQSNKRQSVILTTGHKSLSRKRSGTEHKNQHKNKDESGKKKRCSKCTDKQKNQNCCVDLDICCFSIARCIIGPYPDEPILGVVDKVLKIIGFKCLSKKRKPPATEEEEKKIGDHVANGNGYNNISDS